MFLIYFFIFLFGLAIGSFLNVVIFRMEVEEAIGTSRSHCMDCKHDLAWYDLFPVLSFLALGGKCRYCGKPISWQYPAVEISTALIFLLIFSTFGGSAAGGNFTLQSLLFIIYLLFVNCLLLIIFVYDLKHYVIPDKMVLMLIGAALVYRILQFFNPTAGISISNIQYLISFVFAAFLASGFFLLLVVLSKGKGMGMGDVKLAFALGLILGYPATVIALFLAFVSGSLIGSFLIILKKKNFKSEIPFGPFLVAGTMAAMLWGEEMVKWYWQYLL